MTGSLPPAILQEIEAQTGTRITGFSSASGGCINSGGRVSTSTGAWFLKWNDLKNYPGMFEAESRGLALLRKAAALAIPDVVHAGTAGAYQFLLMEYIEEGSPAANYWERLGSGLAALHKNAAMDFGLDHDNYIGSLPQQNERSSSWVQFFIEYRLEAQLKIARDQGKIDHDLLKKFASLFERLSSLLPEERPALLHGDLWSGNLMTTSHGEPCLIDPAVYYGNREADLAMTQLFGGFNSAYIKSYNEVYPLLPGYAERLDLYNLYPLLVHVNLFGGGYKGQVISVLNRFV